MNFVKFKNVMKDMKDIYIDVDEIMAMELSLMRDNCTFLYTRNGSTFMVDGDFDHVIKMILEGGVDEDPPAYWYKKGIYPGWLYCSNCNEPWSFDTGAPPYCPYCGKKMMKKEENTLTNGKE